YATLDPPDPHSFPTRRSSDLRAAVAVENAQLYARIEHAAQTLQRSLLPATLPDIPFLEIAGEYHPLSMPELVGGDFYDVFETFGDRKSTRLNSSHDQISYAVF